MNEILSKGTSGNLVIMGMTMYDLEVDKSISITSKELVKQIIEPNGIHIVHLAYHEVIYFTRESLGGVKEN